MGNGKGQIFVHGKVVETVPEARVVETLLRHAMFSQIRNFKPRDPMLVFQV